MRTICATLGLILTSTLAGIGCSENPVTRRTELSLISPEQEIALGRESSVDFEKEFGGKVADPTLQEYVSRVGGSVAAYSDRKELTYEFALLNSDVPNAFALPGGFIYITRGLFVLMDNEAQLASVLGHEVGHVAYKHNVNQLQRAMGLQILLKLAGAAIGGDKGSAAEAGGKIVANMIQLRYSRQDEYQADQIGMVYMEKAGYSPWGMVQLLGKLAELGGDSGGGALKEMLSTHPDPASRVVRAREQIASDFARYGEADGRTMQADTFMRMRTRLK